MTYKDETEEERKEYIMDEARQIKIASLAVIVGGLSMVAAMNLANLVEKAQNKPNPPNFYIEYNTVNKDSHTNYCGNLEGKATDYPHVDRIMTESGLQTRRRKK